MNLDTSKWSQADYQTGIALLGAEAGRLETALARRISPNEVPPRPSLKGGSANAITDFAMMAAHVTKLNQLAGLNAQALANPSPTGEASSSSAVSATAFNPDAAILAHRGVKSYAELNAMPVPDATPGAKAELPTFTPAAKPQLTSTADGIGHPGRVLGYDPDKAILQARGVGTLVELNEKYHEGKRIA